MLRLSGWLRAFPVVFSAACLFAEYPPLKSWTSADGLAGDSEIYDMMQDSRGYLWICGALGLSRFDGHAFRNYGKEDGMPSGYPSVTLETKDGAIWVGTSNGLFRFVPDAGAPRRFVPYRFTEPGGLEMHTIHSLAEDPRGGIWIGTRRGLFHANPSREGLHARQVLVSVEPPGKEMPNVGSILSLLVDSHGALWAGTHYAGIYRLIPRTKSAEYDVEHYTVTNGLPSNVLGSFLEDHLGRIWFATPHGLFHLSSTPRPDRGIVVETVDTSYGLSENTLNALAESRDGHLWVGSIKGLAEFDGHSLRTWTTANGLNDNSIFSLLADRQGNLWLGTQNAGIMRLSRHGFTTYRESDGLSSVGQVGAVSEMRGGPLLVVTATREQFPIHVWDGRRFNTILPKFPHQVTFGWGTGQQLLQDHLGEWWAGTYDGLYQFSSAASPIQLSGKLPTRSYTVKDGLPGNNVYALFEDSAGDIWIGMAFRDQRAGLARWKRRENRIEDFSEAFGAPKNETVTSFVQDASGTVWMGFGLGGLGRFQNNHFTLFSEKDGVPPGFIHLHIDNSGTLWGAADFGGVFRVDLRDADHPRLARITIENGLSTDSAFTVTSDLKGLIYAGTRRGIDRIDPQTLRISHLSTADGLANSIVRTSFRDRNGDLWFGTLNGLSKLTVSDLSAAPPGTAHITEIRVDERPVPLSDYGETDAGSVELRARQNHVQISFAGVNLDCDLRFQYTLEGSKSEWSRPAAQQSVVFPGFPDGTYRFLVRALNADDSAGAVAAVSFIVLPPYWQRWWFLLIAAALVTTAAWQWQRLRISRLLEVERLRTRISTDLHDDIGTNLSHIAVLSELERRRGGESEYLAQISAISQETAANIGDVVWAINPQRDSLNDLVLRMRRFAADVLTAGEIEVRFSAPDTEGSRKLDSGLRRQLYLVFKEAVNNVARHAQASLVEIELRVDRDNVDLDIRDNGRGFDVVQRGPGSAAGNGLNNLRSRAQRLKGTFLVESTEGKGTLLKFRAPLKITPQ